MTPERQRRLFDRKVRQLEKKHKAKLAAVISFQLLQYAMAIKSNPIDAIYGIDKYFNEEPLRRAMEGLYIDSSNAFKFEDPDKILKAVSEDTWVTLVTQWIANKGGTAITQVNRFTKAYVLSKLRPILNEGIKQGLGIASIAEMIVANIEEYSGPFSAYRATRIARTEIISTSNWAGLQSIKAAGIQDQVEKFWMPAIDDRTRMEHAEMENHLSIPLDGFFQVRRPDGAFDTMQYPGDPRGSAANKINCRCSIGYRRIKR